MVKHFRIKRVNTSTNQEGERIIRMELNDVCIKMEPDSGADVNLMDEKQFNKFQERTESTVVLRSTKMKLKALKDTLPVKGTFQATLRNGNRGIETEFVVLKGEMDSRPLISHDLLKALGMLKIDPKGMLAESNGVGAAPRILRTKNQQHPDKSIRNILKDHSDVFEGIGLIRDIKNKRYTQSST